jgi:hypothetical protein
MAASSSGAAGLNWTGRTDLLVGVLAVLFPFCLGTVLGTLAGFYGGWLDTAVMRVADVLIALPFYVLGRDHQPRAREPVAGCAAADPEWCPAGVAFLIPQAMAPPAT